MRRRALLFDGGGDGRGRFRDIADGARDGLDGVDGALRRFLDVVDLGVDVGGSLRRLVGQRLDLGGDDGEAAARLAGPGRLDGGVQRKQVGLRSDVADQLDDAVDLAGGFAELVDDRCRLVGLDHGGLRLFVRVTDLAADLADRRAQFLGRRGDGGDVGAGFLGGGRHGRRLQRGFGGVGRQLRGGGLHFDGGGRHGLDDGPHGVLELVGEVGHDLLALGLGAGAGDGGLFFQRAGVDQVVLEHLDRAGHVADLGLFTAVGHVGVELAAGQLAHDVGHLVDRTADAADHGDADADADQRGQQQRAHDQAFGGLPQLGAVLGRRLAFRHLEIAVGADRRAHGVGQRPHLRQVHVRGAVDVAPGDLRHERVGLFQVGGGRRLDGIGQFGLSPVRNVGFVSLQIGGDLGFRSRDLLGDFSPVFLGQQDLGLAAAVDLEVFRQVAQHVGRRQPVRRNLIGGGVDVLQAVDGESAKGDAAGKHQRERAGDAGTNGQAAKHENSFVGAILMRELAGKMLNNALTVKPGTRAIGQISR